MLIIPHVWQVDKVERFKKTRDRGSALHAKYSLSKDGSYCTSQQPSLPPSNGRRTNYSGLLQCVSVCVWGGGGGGGEGSRLEGVI